MTKTQTSITATAPTTAASFSKLIFNAISDGSVVKIGNFRICSFDDEGKDGIQVYEEGPGFTFYDKLTMAGMRRACNWMSRPKSERF